MTQLEFDIKELEDKQKTVGLTAEEKVILEGLKDEWIEAEAAQYGQCLSCFL